MEFSHRGVPQHSQNTTHVAPTSSDPATGAVGSKSKKPEGKMGKWMRIASVVLLFSITILVLAIASLVYYGNSNESQFIKDDKFQAVDLNVGGSNSSDQIYFGHITKLNDKYLVLQNIYYIVPNQQAASGSSSSTTNYTLVKLGCELHAPYDQMIINRDHVVFWENLQTNGTVAQKIAQYQQQNPKGPNCSAQASNSASSASSNATSPQQSTGAATTPTTTTPTTTKKP